MDKDETREHARRFGLPIADKPDSQDICFVPNGRYGDVVRRLRPGAVEPGEIIYHDGTPLGRHDGVIDYTIGQRKGLGIGGIKDRDEAEGPLYVIGINADKHQVIVGERDMLACRKVLINEVNWLDHTPPAEGRRVLARLRNTAPAMPARITGWPQAVRGRSMRQMALLRSACQHRSLASPPVRPPRSMMPKTLTACLVAAGSPLLHCCI